jgi:hypothetical protein
LNAWVVLRDSFLINPRPWMLFRCKCKHYKWIKCTSFHTQNHMSEMWQKRPLKRSKSCKCKEVPFSWKLVYTPSYWYRYPLLSVWLITVQ